MKPFEFGSCIVTSVGSIGIKDCFAPIPPPTFAPLLVAILKKETSYDYNKQGEIEESKTLGFSFTIDFRFVNSKQMKIFSDELTRIGESPEIFEEESNKLLLK